MRIGIDLGGTKIELAVLDQAGEFLKRERVATPQGQYQQTIQTIIELVKSAESELGQVMTVGIGTPGAISPATGLLRNSNSVCLNGKPFLEDIKSALDREVRMANDADCFALSEAIDGVGKQAVSVFGVIVGTGVGGGIVINKQLLSGPNAIAGEWGHNPLPWASQYELPGPHCYCGKQGCIETFLCGQGLSRALQSFTGLEVTAPEIVEKAEQGYAEAEQAIQMYEHRMARALAQVINILDPEVIVLGGGMSNIQRLYNNVPGLWAEYVFSDTVRTRLCEAEFGDSSGVRGAAFLW